MPEHSVSISDSSGHALNLSPAGEIHMAMVPDGSQLYGYGVFDTPGVVAANNFASLFNPVGSGKLLTVYRLTVYPFATGATTATNSLQAVRISAASGGSLVAASTINKFSTTETNPIAEFRTGNPTVTTVGNAVTAIPPAITSAASGTTAAFTVQPPTGSLFTMQPGEGVVARTAAGNVNQLWNIFVTWGETSL